LTFSATNTFVFGVQEDTQQLLWDNLQRHIYPTLVVNILHMTSIPKF
jgi:hypothetical protein